MAELVVAAAGAAIGGAIAPVGFTFLGMSGASIGWTVGSLIGSAFGPKQKSSGPRQEDLKVTGSGYGQPVPWVAGSPRVGGAIIWASDKRETATTTEVGKGGGSEYTEYTYDVDVLYMVSENEITNISRIWSNGGLVYDGATTKAGFCDEIIVYPGADDQLPDPTYETAVGTGNAPAYRGRGTVMIRGLKLGNSGFLPNLTFELGTAGVPAADYVYTYTGETESFVVPDGVTQIFVKAWGGGGSASRKRTAADGGGFNVAFGDPGGGAGYVQSSISVTPGQTVSVRVAQGGRLPTDASPPVYAPAAGGWPNGGNGGTKNSGVASGSGGGASEIRIDGTKVLVAPGGGGGAWADGWPFGSGAPGGGLVAERQDKTSNSDGLMHGGGATQSIGGYAGPGALPGDTGGDGNGGFSSSGDPPSYDATGGGGGGGLNGGGGGGSNGTDGGGGGGGGSAKVPSGGLTLAGSGTNPGGISEPQWANYGLGASGSEAGGNGAVYIWLGGDPGDQVTEELSSVVETLMTRAGYESDEYDVTDLQISEEPLVRAIYLSQVAPTRTALEVLQSAYYITWSKSDKIYFRFRETATAGTFDFDDLGVSDSPEGSDNPFPIKNTNQIERPAQISLTYNNMALDFNQAVVSSDILVTPQKSTNTVQIPLGMVPTQAQGVVESMLLDQEAAKVQYGPFRVPLSYAKYEPSDVVTIPDTTGAEHRVRLVKKTDMGIMLEFEGVGDDEGALNAAGLGDDTDQGQTVVEQISGSEWIAGDWPLMRDADNNAGYLVVGKSDGSGEFWPGAQFVRSWDDVSFSQVATFTTGCVFGICSTTLPDFTAGNVWDESSVLRVNVGSGELSSSTKSAMQSDLTINTAMVGSECIRFRTATLVSAGVYDLNSLIRGFRGTEWAKGSHAGSEDFVLLDSATRRVNLNTGQIGVDQYVKAVTFNLPLSTETSELFTYTGVNLKPWTLASLRCLETSDGDLDLTWDRRTRVSYAYGGTIGASVPLGEATELYRVYVYDGSNLVRTEEVTTQEFLYTAAMMTADGFSTSDVVTFEIVQVSEIVGDGYSEEIQGVIP